jgi:hypothetical protein
VRHHYMRWLAIIGAGGIVFQTTTTSCTSQLADTVISVGVGLLLDAVFAALFGGVAT